MQLFAAAMLAGEDTVKKMCDKCGKSHMGACAMDAGGPGSGRHKGEGGGHTFKTGDKPKLGLAKNSTYRVVKSTRDASFGNKVFSTTHIKNVGTGEEHHIPTGNAQLFGYLPH